MKRIAARLLLSSLALAAAGAAHAASFFGTPGAGWNVGTGQPEDGFWLSSAEQAEVGLRAQDYQVGVSANNGAGDYFVNAGERSPGSGLATWNLDFSADGIDVQLQKLHVLLTIDWDPTAGTDLVSYSISELLASINSPQKVLQDSENLAFPFWNHAFDPYATGTYTATLSIATEVGLLARTTINIHVNGVPEPASAALVALALVGAGAARTRRSSRGS